MASSTGTCCERGFGREVQEVQQKKGFKRAKREESTHESTHRDGKPKKAIHTPTVRRRMPRYLVVLTMFDNELFANPQVWQLKAGDLCQLCKLTPEQQEKYQSFVDAILSTRENEIVQLSDCPLDFACEEEDTGPDKRNEFEFVLEHMAVRMTADATPRSDTPPFTKVQHEPLFPLNLTDGTVAYLFLRS